jgi:hypothetical protein
MPSGPALGRSVQSRQVAGYERFLLRAGPAPELGLAQTGGTMDGLRRSAAAQTLFQTGS